VEISNNLNVGCAKIISILNVSINEGVHVECTIGEDFRMEMHLEHFRCNFENLNLIL